MKGSGVPQKSCDDSLVLIVFNGFSPRVLLDVGLGVISSVFNIPVPAGVVVKSSNRFTKNNVTLQTT